jgi:hypothetical protein
VRWEFDRPLSFANGLMTLTLDGATARLDVDQAVVTRNGRQVLVRLGSQPLSGE